MGRHQLFRIFSLAVAALVLLILIFLVFGAGLPLHLPVSYLLMGIVIFIGLSEVFGVYHAFFSGTSASIPLPYKLALLAAVNLFAAVELVLIYLYTRVVLIAEAKAKLMALQPWFTISDSGSVKVSATFFVVAAGSAVVFALVYALISYAAVHVKQKQDEEQLQGSAARDFAASMEEILACSRQLAGRHEELDFSKVGMAVDKLAIKSRAAGPLYRHGNGLMERDLLTSCDHLLHTLKSCLGSGRIGQEQVDGIGEQLSQILHALSVMDKSAIR